MSSVSFSNPSKVYSELCEPIGNYLGERAYRLGISGECSVSQSFYQLGRWINSTTEENELHIRLNMKIGLVVASVFAVIGLFFAAPLITGVVTYSAIAGSVFAAIATPVALAILCGLKKPVAESLIEKKEYLKAYILYTGNDVDGVLSKVEAFVSQRLEFVKAEQEKSRIVPINADYPEQLNNLLGKIEQLRAALGELARSTEIRTIKLPSIWYAFS